MSPHHTSHCIHVQVLHRAAAGRARAQADLILWLTEAKGPAGGPRGGAPAARGWRHAHGGPPIPEGARGVGDVFSDEDCSGSSGHAHPQLWESIPHGSAWILDCADVNEYLTVKLCMQRELAAVRGCVKEQAVAQDLCCVVRSVSCCRNRGQ
eukprot:1161191-Pelagomonas_calceolata.AAC.12